MLTKREKASKFILSIFFVCCIGVFHFNTSGYAFETGWYTNNPSSENKNNLAFYASQGATIMLPYNCYFYKSDTAAYLEEAALRKIKVWVDLRLHALGSPLPSQSNWQNFINTFKDHSAVKGWYIADEPEYSGPSYSVIQQYYNWTKQVDPTHPVAIAHAWTVKPDSAPLAEDILLDAVSYTHLTLPTTERV